MKVYTCPDEVPFSEPDYENYDTNREIAREEAHMAALKKWLIEKADNHAGKYTGEVLRMPFADGYALYMLADFPSKSFLIHLPYGDKYDSPDVDFLPKKEVIRRIEAEARMREMFNKAS